MGELEIIGKGTFLQLVRRNGWEYATRDDATGVVAIVAITRSGEVVLIEQVRPAASGPVLEIPAGLVGDEGDAEESTLAAAKRELEEETGFRGRQWAELVCGYSSAGLADEMIDLFLAEDLERVSEGGGVDNEDITVHLVPWKEVDSWIAERMTQGVKLDLKVLAGLWAARSVLEGKYMT